MNLTNPNGDKDKKSVEQNKKGVLGYTLGLANKGYPNKNMIRSTKIRIGIKSKNV